MGDIVFYDFDFNRLEMFGRYISSNRTVKYCEYGTFEAHFPITEKRLVSMLDSHEYLLCVQDGEQAMITGWRIDEDDVAVYGKTLNFLLTKRGLAPFERTSETPENTARWAVSTAMSDFLTLGLESGAAGTAQNFSVNGAKTVYDTVKSVLADTGLGFRVRADLAAKKFVFEVYSGSELPLILAQSLKTAHSMTYTKEMQNRVCGSGWYERKMECMGDWDATTNSPKLTDSKADNAYTYYRVSLGDYTRFGLTFKNGSYIYSDTADGKWKLSEAQPGTVWVYIDNPEASGAVKWDAVLSGVMTEDEAKAALSELICSETVDGETRQAEYGTDYSIGDTVRVQFEAEDFKKSVRRRITGVNIFCEGGRCGAAPELGAV